MNLLHALTCCCTLIPANTPGSVQGERCTAEFQAKVAGSPDEVFPLLCPVREYDWIPDWRCELIYSRTGVVENNCIFITHFPGEDPAIWVTTLFDPVARRVEYLRVVPGQKVVRMDLQVAAADPGHCQVSFRYTFTGLGAKGNEEIRQGIAKKTEGHFRGLMDLLNAHLIKQAK